MAEEQVTKSFWTGITTIACVVVASLYVTDRVTSSTNAGITAAMKPLIDQVVVLKGEVDLLKAQMASEISARKITTITQGNLIDFLNEKYHTNFYKPADFFQKPEDVKIPEEK